MRKRRQRKMRRENWIKWDLDGRLDLSMQRLLAEYGLEGYGLYVILIETLCREETHKIRCDDDMFIQTYTKLYKNNIGDTNAYKTFLCDLGLLKTDENYLWSEYVMREMTLRETKATEISNKRKAAISRRWESVNTNAIQTDTNAIQNDTKLYKSKRESKSKRRVYINTPPGLSTVAPSLKCEEKIQEPETPVPEKAPKPTKPEIQRTEVAELVKLSDEEIAKLKAKISEKEYRYWINTVSNYATQNPHKFKLNYKDHYRLIISWRVRRIEEGKKWDEAKGCYMNPPRPGFTPANQPTQPARHVVPDAEATKKMLESLTKE